MDSFWNGKTVFITGNTGFKGSWLSIWLSSLGAEVIGYSLEPLTSPSLFEKAEVEKRISNQIHADVRDLDRLVNAVSDSSPDLVIHMAAQALVSKSYSSPTETYSTNVMGTVNILEAVRLNPGVKAVLNVTTDKCYKNEEWVWGYRENEPLGGHDPYSSSKACSELVTSAYRESFFQRRDDPVSSTAVASARAGNVIGGGDWAENRIVPDFVSAAQAGVSLKLRNPGSVRPWQHVLEPLAGYILLSRSLLGVNGHDVAEAWNFGPDLTENNTVGALVSAMGRKWGLEEVQTESGSTIGHEAGLLRLDSSKARARLGWKPLLDFGATVDYVVEWYQSEKDFYDRTIEQIESYMQDHNDLAGKAWSS